MANPARTFRYIKWMTQDTVALYNAFSSRDPRFDGVFYVGVTSTGIYCRPVCTAKTPKVENCVFFKNAEAAEKASFRPCLRCRPELAPGNAPIDDAHRIAHLIASRIEEGVVDDGAGLETIAKHFGWSSRQIRRLVKNELGVSPIELVLTRRLLLAKQLLTETTLSISDVAFASGFSSVRRFNDAFNKRYRIPPTRLRKTVGSDPGMHVIAPDTFTVQLSYRQPFDWLSIIEFLRVRTLKGVEWIEDDTYLRTIRLGDHTGWVQIRHAPERNAILVELPHSLTPALPGVLGRLRNVFDLNARPDVIATRLAEDPFLADIVSQNPGLRVPGAFDGFELAMRAILGQQISVKAATTLAGRFIETFGEPIQTPHEALTHLTPTPTAVASATVDQLSSLGIVQARARCMITIATEIAEGRLALDAASHPEETIKQLVALPGIGPWTAHYIAMRALRWPDAFPKEDIVLRKNLGGVSAIRADQLSQAWRPWRSYATLHLWRYAP